MNKEIKEEWIKRLRSGKYKQVSGVLHSDNGYCCLGVLCEIAVEQEIIPQPTKPNDAGVYTYVRSKEGLPEKVRKWAGISKMGDFLFRNEKEDFDYKVSLAELNDEGESFSSIANIIEKEF